MDDHVKFFSGPRAGQVKIYESTDFPMTMDGGEYRLEPDLFAPHTPEGEPLGGSGATHVAEWHPMDDGTESITETQ